MMKEIELTKGQVALVNDEDFHRVNSMSWYAQWCRQTQSYYAIRKSSKVDGHRKNIHMSRFVMRASASDKRQVDHINHNTLDNRKSNLRIDTQRVNQNNRRDQAKHGPGIREKKSGRFSSWIWDGKQINVGTFDTAEEAREARKNLLQARGLQ